MIFVGTDVGSVVFVKVAIGVGKGIDTKTGGSRCICTLRPVTPDQHGCEGIKIVGARIYRLTGSHVQLHSAGHDTKAVELDCVACEGDGPRPDIRGVLPPHLDENQ